MAETKPFRENLPCGIKCNFYFQIAYQVCIILSTSAETSVTVTIWDFYRINSDYLIEKFAHACSAEAVKRAYDTTHAKDIGPPVG